METPDDFEDTGRDSTHSQESFVTGPTGQLGLSTTRIGEATEGSTESVGHPALFALGALAVAVLVIVGLVLVFTLH